MLSQSDPKIRTLRYAFYILKMITNDADMLWAQDVHDEVLPIVLGHLQKFASPVNERNKELPRRSSIADHSRRHNNLQNGIK